MQKLYAACALRTKRHESRTQIAKTTNEIATEALEAFPNWRPGRSKNDRFSKIVAHIKTASADLAALDLCIQADRAVPPFRQVVSLLTHLVHWNPGPQFAVQVVQANLGPR